MAKVTGEGAGQQRDAAGPDRATQQVTAKLVRAEHVPYLRGEELLGFVDLQRIVWGDQGCGDGHEDHDHNDQKAQPATGRAERAGRSCSRTCYVRVPSRRSRVCRRGFKLTTTRLVASAIRRPPALVSGFETALGPVGASRTARAGPETHTSSQPTDSSAQTRPRPEARPPVPPGRSRVRMPCKAMLPSPGHR